MTNLEPGGRSPRSRTVRTVPDAPVAGARGMSQVTALVPHLLGYQPDHSLVLLTTTPEESSGGGMLRGHVGLTMRVDLPPLESLHRLAGALALPMARGLGGEDSGTLVHVMAYDLPVATDGEVDAVYLDGLLLALDDLCGRIGVELHDVVLVRTPQPPEEGADGSDAGRQHRPVVVAAEPVERSWQPLPAASDVPAAAELVLQGRAPLGSRGDVVAEVRRRDETASAATSLAVDLLALSPGRLDQDVALTALGRWVVAGEPEPGARDRAWIAVLLHDKVVRDAVMARWVPDLFDVSEVLPPDEAASLRELVPPWPAEDSPAAIGRLLTLASRVPPDLTAPLLTLAGFAAWAHGEGTVAVEACRAALDADRDYRMAQLLERALETGLRPPVAARHTRSRAARRRGVA